MILLRKAAEMIEKQNQDMKDEMRTMHEVENFLRQEIDEQKYALQETAGALSDVRSRTADQAYEISDVSERLHQTEESLQQLEHAHTELLQAHASEKAAKESAQTQNDVLQKELHITRLTCQEMVKASAQKENYYQSHAEEFAAMQQALDSKATALTDLQQRYHEELENALMREEDAEIRIYRLNQLNLLLQQKDDTILAMRDDLASETTRIMEEQRNVARLEGVVEKMKQEAVVLHVEKDSLHRVVADLAVQLQNTQTKLQEQSDLYQTSQGEMAALREEMTQALNERDAHIQSLNTHIDDLEKSVEAVTVENSFLGVELEGYTMKSEDYYEQHRLAALAYKRSVEYTRYLEEELYAARRGIKNNGSSNNANTLQSTNDAMAALLAWQQQQQQLQQAGSALGSPVNRRLSMRSTNEASIAPILRRNFLNEGDDAEVDSEAQGVESNNAQANVARVGSKQRQAGKALRVSVSDTPTILEGGERFLDGDTEGGQEGEGADDAMAMEPPTVDPNLFIAEYMDQKFVSLVHLLEDKMSSMDKAASSMKILMEKAESLERMQSNRRLQQQRNSLVPTDNPLLGLRRSSVRPQLTPSAMLREKSSNSQDLAEVAEGNEEDKQEDKEEGEGDVDVDDDGSSANSAQSGTKRNKKNKKTGKKGKKKSPNKKGEDDEDVDASAGTAGDNTGSQSAAELVQHSGAPSSLSAPASPNALAMAPVPSPEEELLRLKNNMLEDHILMEKAFLEMQANLKAIGDELRHQKADISQLQDLRYKCKAEVNRWRKEFRKLNGRDSTDDERDGALAPYLQQLDFLRDQISSYKANNLTLNAKAIAIQTELYHLNTDLEGSSKEFTRLFQENITTYYPPDLIAAMHRDSPTSQLLTAEQQGQLLPASSPNYSRQSMQFGKSFNFGLLDDAVGSRMSTSPSHWVTNDGQRMFGSAQQSQSYARPLTGTDGLTDAQQQQQQLEESMTNVQLGGLLEGQDDSVSPLLANGSVDQWNEGLMQQPPPDLLQQQASSNSNNHLLDDAQSHASERSKKSKSRRSKDFSGSSVNGDGTKKERRRRKKKNGALQTSISAMDEGLDDSFLFGSASFMDANAVLENPYLNQTDLMDHPLVKTETTGLVSPLDMIRAGTFLKLAGGGGGEANDSDSISTMTTESRMEQELRAMRGAVDAMRRHPAMVPEGDESVAEDGYNEYDPGMLGIPAEDSQITESVQPPFTDDDNNTIVTTDAVDLQAQLLQEEAEAQAAAAAAAAAAQAQEEAEFAVAIDLAELLMESEVEDSVLETAQSVLEAERVMDLVSDETIELVCRIVVDDLVESTEMWQSAIHDHGAWLQTILRAAEEVVLERILREEIEFLKEEQVHNINHPNKYSSPERSRFMHDDHTSAFAKRRHHNQGHQSGANNAQTPDSYVQKQELLRQLQTWRGRWAQTKSAIEEQMVVLQTADDELALLTPEQLEIRSEIQRWHVQFRDLCGHEAHLEDLKRSKVFGHLARTYDEVQGEIVQQIHVRNHARHTILEKVQALSSVQQEVQAYQQKLVSLQSPLVIDRAEFTAPAYQVPLALAFQPEDAFRVRLGEEKSLQQLAPSVVSGEPGVTGVAEDAVDTRRSVSDMNLSIELRNMLGMQLTAADQANWQAANAAWKPPEKPGLENSKVLIPNMDAYFSEMGWSSNPNNLANHQQQQQQLLGSESSESAASSLIGSSADEGVGSLTSPVLAYAQPYQQTPWVPPTRPGLDNSAPLITNMDNYFVDNGWGQNPNMLNVTSSVIAPSSASSVVSTTNSVGSASQSVHTANSSNSVHKSGHGNTNANHSSHSHGKTGATSSGLSSPASTHTNISLEKAAKLGTAAHGAPSSAHKTPTHASGKKKDTIHAATATNKKLKKLGDHSNTNHHQNSNHSRGESPVVSSIVSSSNPLGNVTRSPKSPSVTVTSGTSSVAVGKPHTTTTDTVTTTVPTGLTSPADVSPQAAGKGPGIGVRRTSMNFVGGLMSAALSNSSSNVSRDGTPAPATVSSSATSLASVDNGDTKPAEKIRRLSTQFVNGVVANALFTRQSANSQIYLAHPLTNKSTEIGAPVDPIAQALLAVQALDLDDSSALSRHSDGDSPSQAPMKTTRQASVQFVGDMLSGALRSSSQSISVVDADDNAQRVTASNADVMKEEKNAVLVAEDAHKVEDDTFDVDFGLSLQEDDVSRAVNNTLNSLQLGSPSQPSSAGGSRRAGSSHSSSRPGNHSPIPVQPMHHQTSGASLGIGRTRSNSGASINGGNSTVSRPGTGSSVISTNGHNKERVGSFTSVSNARGSPTTIGGGRGRTSPSMVASTGSSGKHQPQAATSPPRGSTAGNPGTAGAGSRSNSVTSSRKGSASSASTAGSVAVKRTSLTASSATATLSSSQLETMKMEYAQLRRELREWKQSFVSEHQRDPNLEDFKKLDHEMQVKIARKNKLKKLLGERQMIEPSPPTSGKFS